MVQKYDKGKACTNGYMSGLFYSESRPSMNRNSSIASAAVSDDVLAEIYHTQHSEPSNKEDQTTDDSGWMQKREIHQVENDARQHMHRFEFHLV